MKYEIHSKRNENWEERKRKFENIIVWNKYENNYENDYENKQETKSDNK